MIETYEAYLWRQVDTHISAALDALQQLWQSNLRRDDDIIFGLHRQLRASFTSAAQRYAVEVPLVDTLKEGE